MDCLPRVAATCLVGVTLLAVTTTMAMAQLERTSQSGLKVTGQVQNIYSSDDGTRLVELLLDRNQDRYQRPNNDVFPVPGNIAYVAVKGTSRRGERRTSPPLPPVGESIRAILSPGEHGTWTGLGDWYTVVRPDVDNSPNEPSGRTPSTVAAYGMTCKAVLAGGRLGLQVQKVDPTGPAREAGLQPGDVIVGINHRPLTSAADLRHITSKDGSINLVVIDVNSGRVASVDMPVDVASTPAPRDVPAADDGSKVAAEKLQRALGITVEEVDGGVAVKSARAGSGGARAGFEPGDVIVGVGNQRVLNIEEFAAAIPDAPRRLTILVKDVRSGRNVPVEAQSAGVAQAEAPPVPRRTPPADTTPSSAASNDLGIHGELTFYNAEAAVKVVGVDPGSAAAQAGIRPGMILLSANGTPLLHPNDLEDAAKKQRGPLSLRLVNPTTRREVSVTVSR